MKDIFVLHARDIKKSLRVVTGKPFTWFYLGQDIAQRERISRVLGKKNRGFVGSLLQKVAREQKGHFLDFIAELGASQKNRLYWWASNTSYRNPMMPHSLFPLWCYSTLFKKICSRGKPEKEGTLLVFIDDRWLYRSLWEQNKNNNAGLHFLSRKSVLQETLGTVMRGIIARVYILLKTVYHAWQSRHIARKYSTLNSKENRTQVYIYSWVQDRAFGEDGNFQDAYFGKLPEMLADNSVDVAYVTPPFLSPTLKKKCRDYGKYSFTFLDRYIRFGDIVKCLFAFFRISCGTGQQLLMTLLRCQVVYEISSFPVNLLYYFAFKRWLKEINREKTTIIYPFENQPWEKMLCMATREVNKELTLVGYQHSVVPSLLLNYFLGTGESGTMPLPHMIMTSSEYTLKKLRGTDYGETKLVNGGALRYEHIREREGKLTRQEKQEKTALVAMPYSVNLTQELLLAVFSAFEGLKTDKPRFIIKFHPAAPPSQLGIPLSEWPAHFEKTDRPIPEILREIDLLIYSSSTTGLEALLAGVPVIKYCSEHLLDLDPLDAIDGSLVRSCSENNMKRVVLSALGEKSNHLTEQPASSLDEFFSPINEEVWKQVVIN